MKQIQPSPFAQIVADATEASLKQVAAQSNDFRKNMEKSWSLFKDIARWPRLLTLIIPSKFRAFKKERQLVRKLVTGVINDYAPRISHQISRWQNGFDQWEMENAGPLRQASASACELERLGREISRKLSGEMEKELGEIPHYAWHFHRIENPSKMVTSPCGGHFSTLRAQNYCRHLLWAFPVN